jgi:hypothetical protein
MCVNFCWLNLIILVIEYLAVKMNAKELKYHAIVGLYDLAERMIDGVHYANPSDAEEYLNLVEPVIQEIEDSTDRLSDLYMEILQEEERREHTHNAIAIESGLRKILINLKEFQKKIAKVESSLRKVAENHLVPIISEIQERVENIVAIFIELVNISLTRIFSKYELETAKQRNTNIAMLVHKQNLQQGIN